MASNTEFLLYTRTKNDCYDDGEDITPDQLMTTAFNKYKVLLTSEQWYYMSPEQEHIVSLTTVTEKVKDDNLKLSNYVKKSPKNKKGRQISHKQEMEMKKEIPRAIKIGK